jgi:hypothetical protein
MNDGALRAVKIAAIVMGVLIVLGTTTLFVMLAKRGLAPSAAEPAVSAPTHDRIAAILDEPLGTAIEGIATAGPYLAVRLRGGGADRVVLVDPATGRIAGRIALAR